MNKIKQTWHSGDVIEFLRANGESSAKQIRDYLVEQGHEVMHTNHLSVHLREMCREGLLHMRAETRTDHLLFTAPKEFTTIHTNGITWGMEHILEASRETA